MFICNARYFRRLGSGSTGITMTTFFINYGMYFLFLATESEWQFTLSSNEKNVTKEKFEAYIFGTFCKENDSIFRLIQCDLYCQEKRD